MALDIDVALVDAARCGGEALERLITAVWPEAYRVAAGILRDRNLAEDAAQETCAAIAAALPRLKDTRAFRSWSYTAMVRHAIIVGRRRRPVQPIDAIAGVQFIADNNDAIDLYRALGALSQAERAAVLLHYYAGLNSGEIAAATRLSPSTVRFHLMIARNKLRKALSGEMPAAAKEASSNAR
jgi:RNA polymerase sigma-70 factor (ECF subfamily)